MGWVGEGGGRGWRKKQAGVVTIPPFLFVSLIMFGFVYLLFVFITYRFSCGTILFSAGIYFFSELILLKSVILRLSKQEVLIYRLGGPLGLDSLCSR